MGALKMPGHLWRALALVAAWTFAASGVCAAETEWQSIRPGGETVCSNGSDYVFYVREKSPNKLLVHLQGGGACWYAGNCDLKAQATYDPITDAHDHPGERGGIFDLANPENPFADYSIVFVTYCTADVHLGDKVATYARTLESGETEDFKIHHKGLTNGKAALQWIFDRYDSPQNIMVSGSSAGGIASPFYAGLLADHYPKTRIAVVSDGAGGYNTPAINELLKTWGAIEAARKRPQYAGVNVDKMDFETYIEVEAKRLSKFTFAQYNTHLDAVQLFFLVLVGVKDTPLIELLDKNHAEIRKGTPNFRTYIEEASFHTVLSRPQLYNSSVQGTRLIDWIRALAAGEPVEDVRCDCGTP
jgi:hypothetical protein